MFQMTHYRILLHELSMVFFYITVDLKGFLEDNAVAVERILKYNIIGMANLLMEVSEETFQNYLENN